MTNIAQYIARMPKAELHVHIEGTIDPQKLFEMADRNGMKLPLQNRLKKFLRIRQSERRMQNRIFLASLIASMFAVPFCGLNKTTKILLMTT